MGMKKSLISGLIFGICALLLFSNASHAGPGWKPDFKYMKVCGARQGSSWYFFAVNMGLELEKKYPGLKCSALEGNSAKNIAATDKDYTSFGPTFMTAVADAWIGEGPIWKGKTARNIRYLGPFVNEWLTVIVRKGVNIEDGHFTRDIVKLRVSVGTRNWTAKVLNMNGFEALGITEEDFRKAGGAIQYVGYKDMTTMLQDRNLDVAIVWNTNPSTIFQGVANSRPGVYVPQLTKEELEKIIAGQPKRIRDTLFWGRFPDNYLNGDRKGGPAIGFSAPLIVHKDLPDEMVYQIAKLAYESKKVKSCCGKIVDCLVDDNPLLGKPDYFPIHPGALRYWKDRGLVK